MSTSVESKELDHLRQELLRRVEAHPIKNWSPNLLRVFISTLDLAEPQTTVSAGRPGLRLVREGELPRDEPW